MLCNPDRCTLNIRTALFIDCYLVPGPESTKQWLPLWWAIDFPTEYIWCQRHCSPIFSTVLYQLRIQDFRRGANLLLPPANKVCEGYVFTGVCLSPGGRAWQGMCMAGGMCGGGHAWQGGMRDRGACVVGGACVPRMPPSADTTGYCQWAGGTHPTGMHSCLGYFFPKTVWSATDYLK